ncbi:MAG: hypothetical protein ICV63_05265, partial [Coleofasciculus sp. Co-bin14]|nr:hypothetical protein [Coleofasciculus sp. Co-bin14]
FVGEDERTGGGGSGWPDFNGIPSVTLAGAEAVQPTSKILSVIPNTLIRHFITLMPYFCHAELVPSMTLYASRNT